MEPDRRPTTVLIVDDHEAVRIGLCAVLDGIGDLTVVGAAGTAADAVALARATQPDVAVVDLALPDRDGIALCRQLRSWDTGPSCVILSSHTDTQARLAASVAGAAAFVSKATAVAELPDVLRRVADGQTLVDHTEVRRLADVQAAADPRHRLSPQERRILEFIVDGSTNREIGGALGLKEKTVKNYVSRLLTKLDLRRRSEAAALAARLTERDRRAHPWRGDAAGEERHNLDR